MSESREASFTCISDRPASLGSFIEMFADRTGKGDNTDTAAADMGEETKAEAEKEDLGDIFERLKARETRRAGRLIEQNMLNRIRQQTLQYLFRLIWGCREESSPCGTGEENASFSGGSYPAENPGLGMQLYATSGSVHVYYESEQTSFSTTGTVTTADGRSIDFNVEVSMSREFIEYTGVHISETSVMTDPLVLNLDGNPASVSDQKFYFDIDADGKSELIPTLSGGSGLLALDRNADGTINDGSELFGTKSGDAFTDLAEFDLDGNGWIDEADEVFAKLSIWSFGADGAMKQISLKDAGIGAIGLKNVSTGFSLNNAQTNATEAVIRKTGMFLFENGRAGTAQQMDFAIA